MQSSSPQPSDLDLVRAAADGDQDALGHLYDRHSPTLMALAVRLLRDRGEAEDLVHDVFMEAYRKAHSYDPDRASVRTWLLVRLRSRALDRLRSARISKTESLDAKPAPERLAPIQVNQARRRDAQRVHSGLRRLPDAQREVLMLAYFQGLSSTEIAERVGVPTGTVKSRTRTALQKLRSRLDSNPLEAP